MKTTIMNILLIVMISPFAIAQSLVPATSEDLAAFDQQISNSAAQAPKVVKPERPVATSKKGKAANFGSVVSQKAKELKNESQSSKKQMGPWVSEQRKKDNESIPASVQGKDARTSAPANNDRGNSANAPGHSGNRKK